MLLALLLASGLLAPPSDDLLDRVTHHTVENDGVQLHYVTLGEGPLVVMLHGFPDYWYTWRYQMKALAEDHEVVAMDLRGYNRSDAPEGVDAYAMKALISDVAAVIHDQGRERTILIGHDWGGAIAWQVAIHRPALVERLVILNVPHPNGLSRELSENTEQQKNSQYAADFQQEGAHEKLTARGLASWVKGEQARAHYIEAFERSSFEGMLNYYKANYPKPGAARPAAPGAAPPKIAAPVLILHGLEDRALLVDGHVGTWDWVERDLTLVTIPGAGHFVQQDASDLVTRSIRAWLAR